MDQNEASENAQQRQQDTTNNLTARIENFESRIETVVNYREDKLEKNSLEITDTFQHTTKEDDFLLEQTIQKHAAYYHKKFGTITECQTQGFEGKYFLFKQSLSKKKTLIFLFIVPSFDMSRGFI